MDLRTKASVEEGITLREDSLGPRPGLFEYQPGNGTRYVLVITDLSSLSSEARSAIGRSGKGRIRMVSWINGGSGRSMTMTPDSNDPLHWRYVKEKLGTTDSDAVVLAELLGYLCGRETYLKAS